MELLLTNDPCLQVMSRLFVLIYLPSKFEIVDESKENPPIKISSSISTFDNKQVNIFLSKIVCYRNEY